MEAFHTTFEDEIIFSYNPASELHWTRVKTGKSFHLHHDAITLGEFSSWCPLPGNYLCFTGGGEDLRTMWSDVKRAMFSMHWFDVKRDFAITARPSMLTPRYSHASAYLDGYLYVIGGLADCSLKECERYSLKEERWEELPQMPIATFNHSLYLHDSPQMLYALGGNDDHYYGLDSILELSIETLVWRTLRIKLPSVSFCIACFRSGPLCFFVQDSLLYVFDRESITRVKALDNGIRSMSGPSYYSKGMLYTSVCRGAVNKLRIGSLTSKD